MTVAVRIGLMLLHLLAATYTEAVLPVRQLAQQHRQHISATHDEPKSDRHTLDQRHDYLHAAKDKFGQIEYKLQRPEGERTYYVYVPKSYSADKPISAQLSLHGLGDSCEHFADATGMDTLSEKYNYLHVTPCSTSGYLGAGWNAGVCCLGADSDVDDVGFMRAVVDDLHSKYNIDSDKVFASGFSNGAFMSETLACTMPDVFRAVASVSGATIIRPGNEEGLDACDQLFAPFNTTVSVLSIHGDSDNIVPYDGNSLLGFPDVVESMQRWAKRNKCNPGVTATTLKREPFDNLVWGECEHKLNGGDPAVGLHVELVTNHGGGHQWPRIENVFDTSTYILDYFERVKQSDVRQAADAQLAIA